MLKHFFNVQFNLQDLIKNKSVHYIQLEKNTKKNTRVFILHQIASLFGPYIDPIQRDYPFN